MSRPVAILLGSDSDWPYFEKGLALLKEMGVPALLEVSSAHRSPQRTVKLVRKFEQQGAVAIIAAAGGAAHLPGVVAAHTLLPVLGVPIPSPLQGFDSLLSMVQMPGGIPVAVFGIGEAGATNSLLFALSLLAENDSRLRERLAQFRRRQQQEVAAKSDRLKAAREKK